MALNPIAALIIMELFIHIRCDPPPNVFCDAYPDYIETDPLRQARYSPPVINLNRCHGADQTNDLLYRKCVPTSNGITYKQIEVVNILKQQVVKITVQEHTSCHEVCALNKSSCVGDEVFSQDLCTCQCLLSAPPVPNPCRDSSHWRNCRCVCTKDERDCGKKKKLRKRDCGCFCKMRYVIACTLKNQNIDLDTCDCVDRRDVVSSLDYSIGTPSSFHLPYLVIAIESLIILIFTVTTCYRYSKRRLPENHHGNNVGYNTF